MTDLQRHTLFERNRAQIPAAKKCVIADFHKARGQLKNLHPDRTAERPFPDDECICTCFRFKEHNARKITVLKCPFPDRAYFRTDSNDTHACLVRKNIFLYRGHSIGNGIIAHFACREEQQISHGIVEQYPIFVCLIIDIVRINFHPFKRTPKYAGYVKIGNIRADDNRSHGRRAVRIHENACRTRRKVSVRRYRHRRKQSISAESIVTHIRQVFRQRNRLQIRATIEGIRLNSQLLVCTGTHKLDFVETRATRKGIFSDQLHTSGNSHG